VVEFWIIWLVFSAGPGHIVHLPLTGEHTEQYATQAACEAQLPEIIQILKTAWPEDAAISASCEAFTPTEPAAPPVQPTHEIQT
jgi:hypothetical protein